MLVLHQMHISGNCYKVRLTARQTGTPIALREYGLHDGSTRTPDYLAKNPNGRVPMLEFEDGRFLPESAAIIWYLAEGTPLVPDNKWDRAQALQWMFFEQYSHEPFIATVRFWKHFLPKLTPLQEMELPGRVEKGYAALGVMEQRLAHHPYFVDDQYGLADIALYAYTHVAGEGGFNLDNYPLVNAWMARVASQPGHVTIDHRN